MMVSTSTTARPKLPSPRISEPMRGMVRMIAPPTIEMPSAISAAISNGLLAKSSA